MKRILIVFGTRPEAIKMCPVIMELRQRSGIDICICISGQHRQMLNQVLDAFGIKPDYDLAIMKDGQSLFDITISILDSIKIILEKEKPDIVLVHGDTSTTFAVALSCYYVQIPVAHVEAGLRTYDLYSPFPEEFNRQAVDIISKYYFAPTQVAKNNLLREGKPSQYIYITGNTVIDALRTTVREDYTDENLEWAHDSRLIILTAHRRENIGIPMQNIFRAIHRILKEYADIKVIYPIHLNPIVRRIASQEFHDCNNIKLIEPLDVIEFHNYLAKSTLILTDSGGIQEEASSLGKPTLVLRNTTERPEGIVAGTLKLVGTEEEMIYLATKELLESKEAYEKMSKASNPYGDGFASKRIANILLGLNLEAGINSNMN